MKWIIALLFLLIATTTLAQTPEIVMTPADIEIRFSGEVDWINGADATQTIFSVGVISYSLEPLSTNIKHTAKLNEPETWEVEMFRVGNDPFRKAIFVITIYEATDRIYELRTRNRYVNEDTSGPWHISEKDKVIGRTGKPSHLK